MQLANMIFNAQAMVISIMSILQKIIWLADFAHMGQFLQGENFGCFMSFIVIQSDEIGLFFFLQLSVVYHMLSMPKIITTAVVMVMLVMQSMHWLLIIAIHDHHLPNFKQLGFQMSCRGSKTKGNHQNTISKMMGTLDQVQLYTFSYKEAPIRPQKKPKIAD